MIESRCGLICSECPDREDYGCEGCISSPVGYWGTPCEIKECCEVKKITHCGQCADFPCEMLKGVSFDADTGDDGERIMVCKLWADTEEDKKLVFYRRIISGLCIGIVSGIIIGVLQDMMTAWLIAGSLLGIVFGIILQVLKGSKR